VVRHHGRLLSALFACVVSTGCGTGEQLPSYRGAPGAEPEPASQVSSRPESLSERVVRLAREVRGALGDSVLADPSPLPYEIDTMVMRLSSRSFMESDPLKILDEVLGLVFAEKKIAFDRDQSDLANMFPHTVLSRGRGSCLGMSLLLLLVAEKFDVPLHGVLAPEHFFVRYDNGATKRNIETIKQGASFGNDWYRETYGIGDSSRCHDLRNLTVDEVMGVLHYNVGNVYRARGSNSSAAGSYKRAVTLYPGFAEAWGNLGVVLQAMGEDEKALRALEKARELDIGALQIRLARHEAAIAEYRKALEGDPENPELLYGLAVACYGAGKYDKAREHAQRALQLREGYADALALINRAKAMAGVGPS
jgi:regulator of sirC expression with transglutaminase-like and TPR domain